VFLPYNPFVNASTHCYRLSTTVDARNDLKRGYFLLGKLTATTGMFYRIRLKITKTGNLDRFGGLSSPMIAILSGFFNPKM